MRKALAGKSRDEEPKAAHLRTGSGGEDEAEKFLRGKGWEILNRNWREGRLELDLVCRDGDEVVFVEVKTRHAGGLSRPDEAFTRKKRESVVRAARAWLADHKAWSQPCRFDLIGITWENGHWSLEHISHVIELGNGDAVGGGDAAWQPW